MIKSRSANRLAWFLVVLYAILAGAGLWLQVQAGERWMPVLSFAEFAVLSVSLGIWAVMGALIVSRHPGNPIGWILCAIPLAGGSDPFAFGYAAYDLLVYQGILPGADLMILWTAVSGGGGLLFLLLIFLFLLFPNGRPLSNRWLLPAWTGLIGIAVGAPLRAMTPGPLADYPILTNPIEVNESLWAVLDPIQRLATSVILLSVLAAFLSLIIRFRSEQGDARQQIKWLAYTAAFWPIGISFVFFSSNPIIERSAWALQTITIAGLPIAIAIAIFKYRLYDIDIIVNRTLVYGSLTGTLAAVYFASVTLLQQLLPAESQLAIVVSTLAIAALFNPLRLRIQRGIDRLFYRQRYDAEQVMADFSITARDETNLDRLTASLMMVVEKTLFPVQISIWLPGDKPEKRRSS